MRPSCAVGVALLGLAGAACGKAEAQTVPGADDGGGSDWSWLTQEFPEVAEVRPLDVGPPLRDALLAWAPFGRPITVYDPACRPLVLTREDDLLSGTIHDRTEIHGNTKWRSYDTIQFDDGILICSNLETYDRTKHAWAKDSETGGCGDGVGRTLSEVTRDAAWYSGVRVRLSIACVESVVDQQTCAGGASRQCERCDAWGILLESREQGVGFTRLPKTIRSNSTEVDCGVACPNGPPPQRVTRAGAIVAGREFLATLSSESRPYLFRTRAACRQLAKQHPSSADDPKPW